LASIIVGIDPGLTFAIAILNYEGKLLHLESKKHVKKSEIIKTISKFGEPIIVSTDVNPCPKAVENIAHSFGSKIFYPTKSLTVTEKSKLVREYEDLLEDDHQRDALASALKAFKAHSQLFERVKLTLEKLKRKDLLDEVLKRIVSSGTKNIMQIINELSYKEEKIIKKKRRRIPMEYKRIIDKLKEKIKLKDEEIKQLKSEIIELKKFGVKPPVLLKSRKSYERKIFYLRKRIRNLERALNFLKKARILEDSGYVPLLELENITNEKLRGLKESFGLENAVVFSNDSKNFPLLKPYGIKALITGAKIEESLLGKVNFPIIQTDKLKIEKIEGMKAVRKDEFEKELKKARKKGFLEWIKLYKKRKV
jgi:hypothetical protein